jgi:hypothetical protein
LRAAQKEMPGDWPQRRDAVFRNAAMNGNIVRREFDKRKSYFTLALR